MALLGCAATPAFVAADLPLVLAGGSFEEHGGVGSESFAGWTVSVAPGSSGSWYVQTGSTSPLFPGGHAQFDLPTPTDGDFAAMTDQDGPGARVLYQDLQLPFAATRIRCDLFLESEIDDFIIPDPVSLEFTGRPNQHFRFDVMDPAAPLFSVVPGDVLQNVYVSTPGSAGSLAAPMAGYTTVEAPLHAFAGQVVRLRFAQVDNQQHFTVGVDQCVIEETNCPDCSDRELNCGDCVDDDGDGLLDRDDTDCPQRADGTGLGLGDPEGRGRAVSICQKTLEQAAATFAKRGLKRMQRCADAVFTCLQQQPGVTSCRDKARVLCAAETLKLRDPSSGENAKFRDTIVRACAGAVPADVLDTRGLGHRAESAICASLGVMSLQSITDVAECVVRRHACRVQELLAAGMPRAAELLDLGGVRLADFGCVGDGAEGGGQGIGAVRERGKAIAKCQRAIMRAGADLVQATHKRRRKCIDKIAGCVQQAPGDVACLYAARAACATGAGQGGERIAADETRVGLAIQKACGVKRGGGAPQVAPGDLLDAHGLGFAARVSTCATLGVADATTLDGITSCVIRQHQCQIDKLLESAVPRLVEIETLAAGSP